MIQIQEEDKTLKAVLAGLQTDEEDERFERSLLELEGLARACGIETVATLTQRLRHPVPATYLGSGKVVELKEACYIQRADLVVFDKSLSPVQMRNLSRQLDIEVIDRTDLILRIFSDRAQTKEARLQVEYARLDYLLPRLVGMRENLSRQGGTGGFMSARGAGETQLELDRRKILNRQAQLRKRLKEIEHSREIQRSSRLRTDLPRVGLVGYTNAGKSTLMNLFLHGTKEVFVKDMLFATLETTVRRIERHDIKPFLLSDTVGFISNLPTALIDAFRSTLAEAAYADLLLEVVDSSDPDAAEQSLVTRGTLKEIGAGHIPRIRVMNKADLSADGHIAGDILRRKNAGGDDTVYLNALHGEGLDALVKLMAEYI